MSNYDELNTMKVQNALVEILTEGTPMEETALKGCEVDGFFEGGVYSIYEGVVIRTPDGREFQLTITETDFEEE